MRTLQPIVVGLDFSEGSEAALVRAADLAERLHARLHLLYAQTIPVPTSGVGPESKGGAERRVLRFAENALGGAKALDVIGPEVVVRPCEAPAGALVRYAAELGAGLVVVGTHGRRGVRHFLMGSVAEEVVRRAPCPVLTVPNTAIRTAPGPHAPVLAPIDFAEPQGDALAAARFVAALFGAPVELVHVAGEPEPYPSLYGDESAPPVLDVAPPVSERVESRLRRFDAEVSGEAAARYHVREGRPGREIATLAEERGAGLVVMATHGLMGWAHLLLGSVTEDVLRRAPCPVLTLRGGDPEDRPS